MITLRVYDDYNLISLQTLDTDDLEGCKFSKKFSAKTSGYFTIFKVALVNVLFFPRAVTFDLGWLEGRLTRRWKAEILNFPKIKFWVPLGYHAFL